MEVVEYRNMVDGPEYRMELALRPRLDELIKNQANFNWVAGSMRVGAGMPDLTVVNYVPEVFAFANIDIEESSILTYLSLVNKARPETIANRVGISKQGVNDKLTTLIDLKLVHQELNAFRILPDTKDVISNITTIELKVKNWKKAIVQANRNLLFANKSYVAMPIKYANKLKEHSLVKMKGIGIIGIDDSNNISLIKNARNNTSKVWSYYYLIARELAKNKSR